MLLDLLQELAWQMGQQAGALRVIALEAAQVLHQLLQRRVLVPEADLLDGRALAVVALLDLDGRHHGGNLVRPLRHRQQVALLVEDPARVAKRDARGFLQHAGFVDLGACGRRSLQLFDALHNVAICRQQAACVSPVVFVAGLPVGIGRCRAGGDGQRELLVLGVLQDRHGQPPTSTQSSASMSVCEASQPATISRLASIKHSTGPL